MDTSPMDTPLLGPGMAVSAAVRYYRKHFRIIVGLMIPPVLVLSGLDAVLGWGLIDDSIIQDSIAWAIEIPLQAAVLYVFTAEGMPENESTLCAYKRIAGKLPRIFLAYLLLTILFLPTVPVFLSGTADRETLCMFALLVLIALMYLNVRYTLVIPEIVVRDSRLPDAIRFSWRKTKGNFMTVMGMYVVSGLVRWVVILPIYAILLLLINMGSDSESYYIIAKIFRDLGNFATAPFIFGIQMVIYRKLTSEEVSPSEAAAVRTAEEPDA